MNDSPARLRFDFIKSPSFHVVHADGVFGGLTPRGNLFISFYSERFPIPTTTVHELKVSGELGDEIRSEREGRKGIVREVEIGVECDLEVAKSLLGWLKQRIDEAEQHKATHPEQTPQETKENA